MTDVLTGSTVAAPTPVTPDLIMQIGMGFWASKVLLSAVELQLFTHLDGRSLSSDELATAMHLHPRPCPDFLDALLALGLLERDGDGPGARYRNTAETALFLSKASPAYVGGLLEMANRRLYAHWAHLTEALQTGEPQNELKSGAPSFFEAVYADQAALEEFVRAMRGAQLGNFQTLAAAIDFDAHTHFCDLGGADGSLSVTLATAHPHLTGVSFDLPIVTSIAEKFIAASGLTDRVVARPGDFFIDPFPPADVYLMGNILHDWPESNRRALLRKAFEALPSGGIFVAIENVIDDARRHNAFGLLMSLNMLIELPGGSDYTGAQFDDWARAAGFHHTELRPLTGPSSAAIAFKA
jgi:O-methyltransferase domain/Dimerisation domain